MASGKDWLKSILGIRDFKSKADEGMESVKEYLDPNTALTDAVLNEMGRLPLTRDQHLESGNELELVRSPIDPLIAAVDHLHFAAGSCCDNELGVGGHRNMFTHAADRNTKELALQGDKVTALVRRKMELMVKVPSAQRVRLDRRCTALPGSGLPQLQRVHSGAAEARPESVL